MSRKQEGGEAWLSFFGEHRARHGGYRAETLSPGPCESPEFEIEPPQPFLKFAERDAEQHTVLSPLFNRSYPLAQIEIDEIDLVTDTPR